MNRLTDIDTCARCTTPLPPPPHNRTHAARLKRLCKPCRTQQVRENGARAHTEHYALEPTTNARQVILGSAFGDGGFERNSKAGPWRLAIKHGPAQHDYLRWKAALLGPMAHTPRVTEGSKLRLRTITHAICTQTRERFRSNDETVFRSLVADLDLLGWTVFYLDDGCLTPEYVRASGYTEKITVRLACNAFNPAQLRATQRGLDQFFDVQSTECMWTNPRDPSKPYPGLRLYSTHAVRFLDAISPVIPRESGMRYKIDGAGVDNP